MKKLCAVASFVLFGLPAVAMAQILEDVEYKRILPQPIETGAKVDIDDEGLIKISSSDPAQIVQEGQGLQGRRGEGSAAAGCRGVAPVQAERPEQRQAVDRKARRGVVALAERRQGVMDAVCGEVRDDCRRVRHHYFLVFDPPVQPANGRRPRPPPRANRLGPAGQGPAPQQ